MTSRQLLFSFDTEELTSPPASVEYFSPGSFPASDYVYLSGSGKTVRIAPPEFASIVQKMVEPSLLMTINVFDEALYGLLRNRDFLGLQLDHAMGNVSDKVFKKRAAAYLAVEPCDASVLATKVAILRKLPRSAAFFDSETVATMFRCPLSDGEKALGKIEESRLLPAKHG